MHSDFAQYPYLYDLLTERGDHDNLQVILLKQKARPEVATNRSGRTLPTSAITGGPASPARIHNRSESDHRRAAVVT